MRLGYVGRRVLQVVPAVLTILMVGFALVHIAPGDPVLALAGEHGDEAYYDLMRDRFGLDEPLPERTLTYLGRVLRGDLGISYVQGRPVRDVIVERIPATLLLTATALLLSTIAGILLGAFAAGRPDGALDAAVTVMTLGLYAAPVFWIGQLALVVAAFRLAWFPVQGMRSAVGPTAGAVAGLDILHHLVLPAFVLASQEIAAVSRLTRSGLLTELASAHVRTARAKGLSELRVLFKHALRRALLPVVTVVGARAGHLLAGTVVVEVVFSWPGLGRLLITSIQARDMPIILGIFLLVATGVVLANLATDLVYRSIDPRIRYE